MPLSPKKLKQFHLVRSIIRRKMNEAIVIATLISRNISFWIRTELISVRWLATSLHIKLKAKRAHLPIMRAKAWLWYDRTKIGLETWLIGRIFKAVIFILSFAIVASFLIATHFETAVQIYFGSERLARLSTLLVTVGGALVGATAIAFSIVVFSVQINVERTPDGLFQTLSRDGRLIIAFFATVALSVTGAALSLIADAGYVARIAVVALWIVILVPSLIVYAYLRALELINPRRQIRLLFDYSARYLAHWSKRADHATPLILSKLNPPPPPNDPDNSFDYARELFFRSNNSWATLPSHAISQAMTFARNYAKTGDNQVVAHALFAIVRINSAYIETRGRTFYSHNPLINDDRSSDGIINHTLEAYRQNIRNAVKNNNETEITQFLSGLGMLTVEYSKIRYPQASDPLYHASLAERYMSQEVIQMLPSVSTDIMMRGATCVSELSSLFLREPDLNVQQSICATILAIAEYGLKHREHSAATFLGLNKITKISMMLVRATGAASAHSNVTKQLFKFAENVFATPDIGFTTPHADYLSPYFGGGNVLDTNTFDSRLTDLVNQAMLADEDSQEAKRIIDNLADWSEELPQQIRKLLQTATASRTRYSAAIVWWIINVSTALYAASIAIAGDKGDQETLKESAGWMMSALNFIPHDEHGVAAMGAVNIPEQLFRMSSQLRAFNLDEEANELGKIIEAWLLETIPHTSAYKVAEGLFGLGVLYLYLSKPQEITALCTTIQQQLPLKAGLTQAFKKTLAEQINMHLVNVESRRVDGISYVEHMAENMPNAALRANTEKILQAIKSSNCN